MINQSWVASAARANNEYFLDAIIARFPEEMAAIEREWKRHRTVEEMQPHRILEHDDGRRAYVRTEYGNVDRVLQVWSLDGCRRKLEEKQRQGKLEEFFKSLYETLEGYSQPNGDLMFREWFTECFRNCEIIYDEILGMIPKEATIEIFGLDDEMEIFGL